MQKISAQAENYLSKSLNLPSIIAGTCFMGLTSEDELNYWNYLEIK